MRGGWLAAPRAVRVPAAAPAIALLAGAACGLLAPNLPAAAVEILLAACGVAAVCAWRADRGGVLLGAVCVGFVLGGALLSARAWREAWRPTVVEAFDVLARAERAEASAAGRRVAEDETAFATVTGVLRADGAPTGAGVSLALDVDSVNERAASGGVLATVVGSLSADRLPEWRAGRRLRAPIHLRRPSRYLNADVPDGERALARRGVALVGTVKSGALVEVVARAGWIAERVAGVRAFARRAIRDAVGRWSARSSAIVAAIVIGDRVGLDEAVERRLQDAGTYHVIAISGGNIAILAGLFLGAFRVAGLLGRMAMLSAIASLVAYAALVGGGASVERATLMAVVYFGARAWDQRSPPLNILALVAGCLLVWHPLSGVDPAFVLTFGATLAIFVVVPLAPRPGGRAAAAVTSMFVASAATEAVLFPVGALVFSRITVAGLALNFLAIPLMAVAQIAGMALVPAAALSPMAARVLGWTAHVGAAGLVASAELVRVAPWSTYRVAPPAPWVVILYYAALVALWMARQRRDRLGSAEPPAGRVVRRASAVAAALAALWILGEPWAIGARRGDGRLHVTFIDVGQGDAAFVRFPRGRTLLVDAGGLGIGSSFDIGDRVVAPVLRAAGVRRLDALALTHGDPDHIGGATSIVGEFRPRVIWEGIPVPRFEPLRALHDEARARGVRLENLAIGDHVWIDEVEIVARHPDRPDWERQRVRNDDSLVLELRWREASVLLTGDIGRPVEPAVAARVAPSPLRVVKVPHHGSLTSSTAEFIRRLAPTVAVVSAGRANHFGHPVPEVLDRYRAAGAAVFRTDQDGEVTMDSDGWSIDVHTFSGRHLHVSRPFPHHEHTKDTKQ